MFKPSVSAIVAIVALLGGPAIAAPKNNPSHTGSVKVTTVKKASPTDILGVQLVLNRYKAGENYVDACRRANFKNLAIAFGMNAELLTREKGEFETSEQYTQRTNKLAEILSSDPLLVCLAPHAIMTFAYHADDERFVGEFGDKLDVWRDIKELKPYRSKTRMGITALVKPSLVMEYDAALSIPSYPAGCLTGDYNHSFQFPYGRDEAPLLKTLGKVVLVARLDAPYVEKEDIPGNPTLDDPYDVYTHKVTVHIRPERLVIADYKGNEIWSCRVGLLPPLQSATPQGNVVDWLSSLDYPISGYQQHLAGTVKATLIVGVDGKVSGCRVVSSSGSSELDQATCAAWTKRAKFTPASDGDGNAIPGEFTVSKTWSSYGF